MTWKIRFVLRLFLAGGRALANPERLFTQHAGLAGGARLTDDEPEMWRALQALLVEYAPQAPDRPAAQAHLAKVERLLARALVACGRWAEAQPLLKRWLKARPFQPTPLGWWLRSLLPTLRAAPRPPPLR